MWAVLGIVGGAPVRPGEDKTADRLTLARMARGEHDALAELYDRHARGLYSLALRILQDRADAEDVVQDVFAQAWTQAARYDRAIDRLRSKRARPDGGVADDAAVTGTVDGGDTPDLQLLSAEQVSRVREALRSLPLLQRVAIEMAYYEGLSHSEIAGKLEQPLGTVKTRIRQAMIRLRESLAGTR